MGVRSEEAMRRRAEKRGRTLEEQKAADRASDRKQAQLKEAAAARQEQPGVPAQEQLSEEELPAPPIKALAERPSPPPAAISTHGAAPVAVGIPLFKLPPERRPDRKLKKDEKRGWVCMGVAGAFCGELNFAYRRECRKCNARCLMQVATITKGPKHDDAAKVSSRKAALSAAPPAPAPIATRPDLDESFVAAAAAAAAAAGETGRCKKCGQMGHWARHCTAAVAGSKRPLAAAAGGSTPEDVGRAGGGPSAKRQKPPSDPTRAWQGTNAAGSAEANAALRARYTATPDALSADERERAEALLARDARKAERREQIRTAKAQVKRALKTTLSRSGGGTSSTYLPPGTVLSPRRGPAPGAVAL